MENRFKLKFSRFFRSCKTKNLTTDVVLADDDTKTGFHNNNNNPPMLFQLFSPKPRTTFPSLCRPRFHQPADSAAAAPPALSPILPPYPEIYYCGSRPPRRPRKRRKNRKTHLRRLDFSGEFPAAFEYKGLFSSDEEEENKSTLFSSRSLSFSSTDDSSVSRRRRGAGAPATVKDSFAVVKRSSDPYGDFRASMLEMILEKQMFGAKDLEKLLECFLSLNSGHHHGVIIDVFTEICETLFSICRS